jgi:hypothetical protein
MFTDDSRYKKQEIVEVSTGNGKTVPAVKLRKLTALRGNPYTVRQNDRLDLIAYGQYKKPTRFWYIADANTELEAKDLASRARRIILVPEN